MTRSSLSPSVGAYIAVLIISLADTLTDRADELHGKHTLFGRVMGDTIYSASRLDMRIVR